MWAGLHYGGEPASEYWIWGAVTALTGAVWMLWWRARLQDGELRRAMRIRAEFEAYSRLDGSPVDGDVRDLARQVCRVVTEKSAFSRAAMLLRDAEGKLYVVGSVGMEEQTVAALRIWGGHVAEAERSGEARSRRGDGGLGMRVGEMSFAIVLGKQHQEAVGCGRAIVIPMWTSGGRMVGALAVCADRMLSVRRSSVVEAMAPLEALAMKLGRSVENVALAERLLRSEQLAGLGLLAGGVAHALNNPLTAVLGFAELIANTSTETRVRADAETIIREARRMRQTVESILNYRQPLMGGDETVEVPALLRELAGECAEMLEDRGVRLVVQAEEGVPAIRGNRERLRQVMEHLLNNAAQAVGAAQKLGVVSPLSGLGDVFGSGVDGGQHSIRVTVSHDERALNLIVSDTGTGFREPARVFDPFYASRRAGDGAGVGLSICYGIVREHGGEISAFNLHPHGAAVIVELPVAGGSDRAIEDEVGEVGEVA